MQACTLGASSIGSHYPGLSTSFLPSLPPPYAVALICSFNRFRLDTLRTGVMAGSPCPVEVMRRVQRDMHMREITICYGECILLWFGGCRRHKRMQDTQTPGMGV